MTLTLNILFWPGGLTFQPFVCPPPHPTAQTERRQPYLGVGRDYGGEIAVVVIVRAVVTPVVWGRGDVRHDVAGKGAGAGRRLLLELRLRFPHKAASRLSANVPRMTHSALFFFFLFAASGGFALFSRAMFKDGSFLLTFRFDAGEEAERRGSGRVCAPRRSAATTPGQTLRSERFGGGGGKETGKNIGE